MFERFSSDFLFEFEKKFEESGNKDVLTHTLSAYCHGRKLNLEDDSEIRGQFYQHIYEQHLRKDILKVQKDS